MRALLIAVATIFVAGCATAPASGQKVAIYDHKYNQYHFVNQSTDSDFVGASAKTPSVQKAKPGGYPFGHM